GLEASRAGKPFIVSPHGNILNVRALWPAHKVLYRDWVLKRALKRCAYVHALSSAEAEACRRFGVTCPIRVIPNGLPAEAFVRAHDPALALENWPVLKGRRVLLFMGRLAPLKGLDLLLPAFSRLRKRDGWILVVAGHDYRGYSRHVAAMAGHFGLGGSIVLPGPVRGELKQSLLGTAEAFVLPSYIEGFSVALLEALSASLPCVFTTQCHFKELAHAGGGWETEPEAGALGEALGVCLNMDRRKLKAMGAAANRLGRAKYTLDAVADGLLDMYRDAVRTGATSR
ncbi:MAG: glycosyltransferase, partial [bacterium]